MCVEDHHTILHASESLSAAVQRINKRLPQIQISPEDLTILKLHLATVESVADFLEEKANVIAETQP